MRRCDLTNVTGTSDSTSSSAEEVAVHPSLKKRKGTYYVRKDTIDALQSQVEKLQQDLVEARELLRATPNLVNVQYSAQIKRNHEIFAGIASMVSSYKQNHRPAVATPLATFIHLPKHQAGRDQKLHSLHKPKVDTAVRFMVERTRFLDLQLKHFHEERVHEPSGDATSVRLDVTWFERRFSLRQVYEALTFYLMNQENFLSEVTSKADAKKSDSDGCHQDFQCRQVRVSSTISDGGVKVVSNSVTFLSIVEEPTIGIPLGGHAIATSDFVDQDDLQTQPSETDVVREELTSAVLVTETMTPTGAILTLSKWEHSRFRAPPAQTLTRKQVEELHLAGKHRWDVMLRVIHERLQALW